jgi:hypothetical protein
MIYYIVDILAYLDIMNWFIGEKGMGVTPRVIITGFASETVFIRETT